MKTSVIEVHDMLSVLSVEGVEQKIGEVPGVESATVNYAAGNATVRYDETRLELADIKSSVRQSAFSSDAPAAASTGDIHENHRAPSAPLASPAGAAPKTLPAAPAPAGPKTPPVAAATAGKNAAPAGGGQPEIAPVSAPEAAAPQ